METGETKISKVPTTPNDPSNGFLTAVERVMEGETVEDVREIAAKLKREGVESVAVCLLHSYVNPTHEELVRGVLAKELARTYVTISSEICPIFREYPRASTTAINAVLLPIVSKYISRL